jgi:dienelactone hydrolase
MLELIPFSTATYWMNFAAHMAASAGATMGDIERAMKPYLAYVEENREAFERAKALAPLKFDGNPATVPLKLAEAMFAATPIWCKGWIDEGERLAAVAESFRAAGQTLTAGEIFKRASILVGYAEWSMLLGPDKRETFDRGRSLCMTAIDLLGEKYEEVKIPYAGTELDGMFWPAAGEGRRPTAVCFNGLHSSMEWFWQIGLIRELNRRGISVLVFDCPGSGTARFHKGLHIEPETERYAKPALDYVLSRGDVDPHRVAAVGCSFGGYRTVRAASTDPRFRMCLAWGALYGIPEPQKPVDTEEDAPSGMNGLDPRTMLWFMGVSSAEEWEAKRPKFTLRDVIGELRCDLVVFHGKADMQVPVSQAHRVVGDAVNATSRELHLYTAAEGGEQHCHLDSLNTPLGHMTDRVAAILQA